MSAHPAGPRSANPPAAAAPVPPAHTAHAESVWPANAQWDDHGLTIAGVRASDLVREHGSPLFVIDEHDARARARAYATAYAGCDVFYAAKAFLSVDFARWMLAEGLGIDVCTLGELRCALAAGASGDRLLMHGNNKSAEELAAAVEANVRFIVVDSLQECARLAELASQRGVIAEVLVRVTVGVEAHTHEFIATAHEDQKFGFSLASGAARAAVDAVVASPHLRFAGLHSHIGSQIFDEQGFLVAVARLIAFCRELGDAGISVANLNLGGGAGISYLPSDDPVSIADLATRLRGAVSQDCAAAGLPAPRIIVEPGRSIAGPAGITLYTVGTVKDVVVGHDLARTYVSVDGGMSDNIRTSLYDADYTVAHASRRAAAGDEQRLARIVGRHCESGDIVVRDAHVLADISPGELLAVAATGAYCRSMSSNYNHTPRPAVVAVRAGTSTVLIRRESLDDLLALDEGMLR